MKRSRSNERLSEASGGAVAAAKNAKAERFKLGNRDLLDLLGKEAAMPEIAELEQAQQALLSQPASADPGAGGAGARAPRRPPDVPPTGARAEALTGALGAAQTLPSRVRGPMEQALGRDLSGVEVFQGAAAAAKASEQGAEAFTIGESIVLGGDFQPGTLFGDALLAHELAHVAHQAEGGQANSAPESELENEADLSAAALVAKLMGVGEGAREIMRNAAPRARSGVRVQRCSGCGGKSRKAEKAAEKAQRTAKKAGEQGKDQEENNCPAGPDAKKVEAAAEGLKTKFGFSGVTADDGSCWTVAELQKMSKAFGRMSGDQQAALKGVELRRVATANCGGHSADGCFTASIDSSGKRADRLEMGDAAFAKDKDFDEGGAYITGSKGEKLDLKPSEETALHEAGHAIENVQQRAVEGARIVADNAVTKAQADLDASITAFNRAFPAPGRFPATSNAADAAYVKAIIAWVKALQEVTKPTDVLGAIAAPTKKDFDNAIDALAKLIKRTQGAQKSLTVKAGKLPASSSIRDATLESQLASTQTAAEDILVKLKARRDAQKDLDKAKSAERAVKASIKLGGASTPTGMSRRLADFVALLHVRGVDPTKHESKAPYGTSKWPDEPGELFADYYELSRTRPAFLKAIDSEVAKFFTDPIGVKDAGVKKKVDAWIKARR